MMIKEGIGQLHIVLAAVLSVVLLSGRAGAAATQPSEPVVLVLAGQSNMVGQGRTKDLSDEQKTLPANVRLFLGNEETVPAERARFGPELTFA
jgi:hypothetical protein